MTTFGIKFAPEALEQLDSLEQYIAEVASSTVAAGYIDAIVSYCESLQSDLLRKFAELPESRHSTRRYTAGLAHYELSRPYGNCLRRGRGPANHSWCGLWRPGLRNCAGRVGGLRTQGGKPLGGFLTRVHRAARQGPRLFFASIVVAIKENTPKVGSMPNFWGALQPPFDGTVFL